MPRLAYAAFAAVLLTVLLAGYFFLPRKTEVKTVTVTRIQPQPLALHWSKHRLLSEFGTEIAHFPSKQLSPQLGARTCHVYATAINAAVIVCV